MMKGETPREPLEGWKLTEKVFDARYARKYESIFCQGNGYMGVRAATEETYPSTRRGTLIAGTFDRIEEKHSTELPVSADVMAVDITLDGAALSQSSFESYERVLNLQNGLLTRRFLWRSANACLSATFERFVSLKDRHVLGQRITLHMLEGSGTINIETGISGSNRPGIVHFQNAETLVDGTVLQYAETTVESGIDFVTSAIISAHVLGVDTHKLTALSRVLEGEGVMNAYSVTLRANETLVVEKLARIATTRDNDFDAPPEGHSFRYALMDRECVLMTSLWATGFNEALAASIRQWARIWETRDVQITEATGFDQLALRFAVYHLTIMAPLHDSRMNIAAKGLTGPGYLGHTFWDTETYILPYFVWCDPKGARSLLHNRYLFMDAAHRKAQENGYEGAMYPWQTAWLSDTDTSVNPRMSACEHHITADVAYGVQYYYQVTGDLDFMLRFGCEILFETAKFWCSRLQYSTQNKRYELLHIMGPDEYHISDNNAYTNYLAYWNLRCATEWAKELCAHYPKDYAVLCQRLGVDAQVSVWEERAAALYLPQVNQAGILPQDDTFLSLPQIDLAPYKQGTRSIRADYDKSALLKLQVAKQADVAALFLLLEDLFPMDVKKRNIYYYEEHCVHESSLSLCTYSLLASDIDEQDSAYAFYQKACRIDLGNKMDSSDEGIHAASLGGIWQCVVLGFIGVRARNDMLCICPKLPARWKRVTTRIFWQGQPLTISAEQTGFCVKALEGDTLPKLLTPSGLHEAPGVSYRETY
ncbi:MAG: family 65 glycosyl hydrolase [Eubacteriales bacterium]|nr:family 65 glycosyl hydrolase [Eubacteriales bacterium]